MNLHHLSSADIFLRRCQESDASLIYEWENNPLLDQTNTLAEPISMAQVRQLVSLKSSELLETGTLLLIVALRSSSQEEPTIPIGFVQFYNFDFFNRRSAIGIVLDPQWHKKGYGKRVLRMMINYAFKALSLNQVYAEIFPSNIPAIRCFQSLGFAFVASLPDWYKTDEEYQNLDIYRLTKTHFCDEPR